MAIEAPSVTLLMNTLATGFRADLITSTIGILIVVILGGVVGTLWWIATRWQREPKQWDTGYRRTFIAAGSIIAILLVVLLLLDIGYYRFNQQRLNFVFFEYVGDLLTQWKETGLKGSQAAGQTGAELGDHGKWIGTVLGFLFFEMLAVVTWWWCFTRMVKPVVSRFMNGSVLVPSMVLLVALAVGLTGFHHRGPEAIRAADISSAAYYTLAQNPVLYASEGLRAMLGAERTLDKSMGFEEMPLEEAVRMAQDTVAPGAVFPYRDYPFVHETVAASGVPFAHPANVLLIFVEGLDRRFLNKTVGDVRVTPFLDRLREASVYF